MLHIYFDEMLRAVDVKWRCLSVRECAPCRPDLGGCVNVAEKSGENLCSACIIMCSIKMPCALCKKEGKMRDSSPLIIMLKDDKFTNGGKAKKKLFSTIQIFEFLGDNRKLCGMTIEWVSVGGTGMRKLFMNSDLTSLEFSLPASVPGQI